MGVEEQVRNIVESALGELAREGALPAEARGASFVVERPKRAEHGDLSTNAALAIQKLAKKPPREVATLLADRLKKTPWVTGVEIAGPGFLNLRLSPSAFHEVLADVLTAGPSYGRAPSGSGERILLEFVSANPTGPLLISHGRGAILGDAVATLLEAAGHRVTREYYINDFGNQIRLLAESVRTVNDGTGVFQAARVPIVGRAKVAAFHLKIAKRPGAEGARFAMRAVNGLPSLVVDIDHAPAGVAPRFVLSCELDARGAIRAIYTVLAPDKLRGIARAA